MLKAELAANCVRTAVSCATVMMRGPAAAEYVRQVRPSTFSIPKPGASGSGSVGVPSRCQRLFVAEA